MVFTKFMLAVTKQSIIVIYFNYKISVMDLEFITAMLNHEEMSLIFKRLRKYKSPFIVMFDNMTDRLAVIF